MVAYNVTYRNPDGTTGTMRTGSKPGSRIALGERPTRSVGYDVTYRYEGQEQTVRMDEKPGERLPVIDGQVVTQTASAGGQRRQRLIHGPRPARQPCRPDGAGAIRPCRFAGSWRVTALQCRPPIQWRTVPTPSSAMALHPYDLYDVRSLLSEEERAVQDTVARFTDERVLPIIGDAFDQGRFPKELVPEIAELGLLGSSLPEQYGCAGLNAVSYGLICQELERGDSRHPQLRQRAVARCACIRSTPTAAKSSACAGCRTWPRARSSAASA